MTNDERVKRVDLAVHQLREFFPVVQVLTSWEGDDDTMDIIRGSGNWYARQGLAREFIQRDQSQTTAHEIEKVLPHDT